MTLDEEFEKNVEVVVDGLENLIEIIEQQFIYEDLGTKKIKGITLKTSLGKGLKEKALHNVSVTMFMTSSLWRNAFNEILMWLNRYMPQFKRQIEQQYSNIVSQLNAILSVQQDLQYCGLLDLKNKIGKLANDLRYCEKIARAELTPAEKEPGTATPSKCSVTWSRLKKALCVIAAIVVFLAALLTCLYYLGLLVQIKAFIYKILPEK